MRKLICLCFGVVLVLSLQAQPRKYFCEIKGIEKEFSAGLKIIFDFGESSVYSIWGGLKSKQKLVDENGEEIEFNSMVDAANFMADKGWRKQFTDSYNDGNRRLSIMLNRECFFYCVLFDNIKDYLINTFGRHGFPETKIKGI